VDTRCGGPGGHDSRRQRRVSVDLPGSVGVRSPRFVRVVDVSLVGCLLSSGAALDEGAVVDLHIDLPDGPVRVKARVAQCSVDGTSMSGPTRYLAGLEFLGLAAADEPRLRSFLASMSRRSRGAGETPS
jgi:hypothetical protein